MVLLSFDIFPWIRGTLETEFPTSMQVVGDLMVRIQRIQDFTPKLLLVRKRLLGLEPEGPM